MDELLIEKGFLAPEQFREALACANQRGLRLEQAVVARGFVPRDTLDADIPESR